MSWQKQTSEPLYPDLHWSRPVNKAHAGKLLIIGGNTQGFSSVSFAQQETLQAGIGESRIVVPSSLKKYLGLQLDTEYVDSTSIGSLSRGSLPAIVSYMHWADATWIAGDIGKNSETNLLVEDIVQKTDGRLILSRDAIDQFYANPSLILDRDQTLVCCDVTQIQKLSSKYGPLTITSNMGIIQLAEFLQSFTETINAHVVLHTDDKILIGVNGEVVSSAATVEHPLSAQVVWWTQFPSKPLESLTAALVDAS